MFRVILLKRLNAFAKEVLNDSEYNFFIENMSFNKEIYSSINKEIGSLYKLRDEMNLINGDEYSKVYYKVRQELFILTQMFLEGVNKVNILLLLGISQEKLEKLSIKFNKLSTPEKLFFGVDKTSNA